MKTAVPDPARVDRRTERRRSPRAPVEGHATAFCLGGGHFGETFTMDACDYCPGGMAAVSSEPLPAGCDVSVGFEAPHCLAGRGRVLRCQPCEEGYRVAIRFLGAP
ncbi:MAG: PilZ domain-containing protein [Planctomycetota bacterium]|nr:PilZ domain-containing protein [Planctomycetota bacterium]